MRKISLALVSIIILTSVSASLAGDIYHQRAVELRGGISYYLDIGDPIDWPKTLIGSDVTDEILISPEFGLSMIYRSHSNFVWNIGYNYLFNSSTFYKVEGNEYEETVSASELFVMAGFILNPEGEINLSLTAGPTLLMAFLDRISPPSTGSTLKEFYGASGRNVGVLAMANLEYLINQDLALKVGGGFRGASISNLGFEDSNKTHHDVMWTEPWGTPTSSAYTIDFTGLFFEAGLRIYFTPKKQW